VAVIDVQGVTLNNLAGETLATLTASGQPRASLKRIDGDTVTAVNAFLRPFGKVKTYWRTGEYRWHPLVGQATKPAKVASAPRKPLVTPAAAPVAAPVQAVPAPVAPVVTPSVPVRIANGVSGVIETVRRWQDTRKKQPVVKPGVKGYVLVDDVLVPGADVRVLDAMKAKRDAGYPAFGLITGPAGTAKTRLAQAWAFTHDLPVVVVDGMSIQTATDWYGMTLPKADGVGFAWEWSDAAKLILTGAPCLIVLDELNRPENERALNGIMPLTDWKATAKPMGAPHALTLSPGQCIIATLNEGVEYVGTVEVDAAVRDRFGAGVRMDYTVEAVEARILVQQVKDLDKDVAKRLVRVAAGQRAKRDDDTLYPSHNVISTRVLVDAALSITVGGLDAKEALWGALRSRFWPEDFAALTVLIEAQFGPDAVAEDDGDDLDEDEVENMLAGV
jgi:MoxR-like ATPase